MSRAATSNLSNNPAGRWVHKQVEDRSWATKEYVPTMENHNDLPKGFEFVGDKERVLWWSNAQDIM